MLVMMTSFGSQRGDVVGLYRVGQKESGSQCCAECWPTHSDTIDWEASEHREDDHSTPPLNCLNESFQ